MLDPREKHKQSIEVTEWRNFKERYGATWMLGERPRGDLDRWKGRVVVDLGAGPRKGVEYLPARLKIKLDCSMIAYHREGLLPPRTEGDGPLLQAMGEALPFADASIDAIICINTLDHCFDPEAVVAECRRVLVPHGELHVEVDLGGVPTPCEPVVFTESRLRALFHGFDVLHGETGAASHSQRDSRVILVLRKP